MEKIDSTAFLWKSFQKFVYCPGSNRTKQGKLYRM